MMSFLQNNTDFSFDGKNMRLLIISIVVPRLLIFSAKYIHDHDTEVSCWKPIETGGYKNDKNNQ